MSTALKVRRSIDSQSIESLRNAAITRNSSLNQSINQSIKQTTQSTKLRSHQLDWVNEYIRIDQSINQSVKEIVSSVGKILINDQSINQSVNQSVYQSVDQSLAYEVKFNQSINQSIKQLLNQSKDQIQAFSLELQGPIDRINQSIQSIKQSINQSINDPPSTAKLKKPSTRTINQSINQSVNQSINQSNDQQIAEANRLINVFKMQQKKFGALIDQSINQSINQLTKYDARWLQSIEYSINQSANQSVSQSTNQSINQSIIQQDPLSMFDYDNPIYEIEQIIYQSIYHSLNQSINQSTENSELFTLIEKKRVEWQINMIEQLNLCKASFNQSINHFQQERLNAIEAYNQSINQSVSQSINQSAASSRPTSSSRLSSSSTSQSLSQSINQSTSQSVDQSVDQSINQSISQSAEQDFLRRVALVYREYSHRNQPISKMIDRLKIECPNQSINHIQAAIDRNQSIRFVNEKKKNLIEKCQRETKELIDQSISQFRDTLTQCVQSINQSINQSILAEQQVARHSLLEEQRSIKAQRDKLQAEIQSINQSKLENEAKIRAEQEKITREQTKQSINQYHTQLEHQKQKAEALYQSDEKVRKQEANKESKFGILRIKVREQMEAKKIDDFRGKNEAKMAEIRALEVRLDAIRAQVTQSINVERDFQRLIAPTIASQLPDQSIGPLFVNHGYDEEKTLSDPRMRLAAALFQAGLTGQSEAVRQALSTVQPARPERREMKSTVFAE